MASAKRKDKNGYVLRVGECCRSDGRYSYSYTDREKKRHVVYAKNIVELREKEKQIARDRDDGLDIGAAARMTLNELYDRYISQKFNLKPTTMAHYINTYDSYVRDTFGKRRIVDIKYSDVKRFYYSLMEDRGLMAPTIDNVHTQLHNARKPLGPQVGRKLMRDLRLYMAVGGMPQAVEAYVEGKNFTVIDRIKREIISLYEEDFNKIDPSGRISAMYHSIPTQLSKDGKRYLISKAIGKRRVAGDEEALYDLIDSKTVLISYNTTDPRVSLSSTRNLESYKMYLSDKLPANLGYLYENLVAQMIVASGRALYYHTWEKEGSTHYYEIDFLVSKGAKVNLIEVKSSGVGKHDSLTAFRKDYSKNVWESFILSQKDISREDEIQFLPVYLTPFVVK